MNRRGGGSQRSVRAVLAFGSLALCGAWPHSAQACDVSGWVIESPTNTLSCVTVTNASDPVSVANGCDAELHVSPADCPAPCSDAVVIAQGKSGALPLPASPKNGDKRELSYTLAKETDSVTFEYVANECSDDAHCSTAIAPRPNTGAPLAGLCILLVAAARLRRR